MRARNQLRIIGGDWRGRKLEFIDQPGLRPTPDRVRETLFNWLMPVIPGSRCLDLFAGSGALGLEAASRGARWVTLVEQAAAVARQLQANVAQLGARERVEVRQVDALRFLAGTSACYDVVFLDPPFKQGWLARCLPALSAGDWLRPDGYLYVEAERELTEADIRALLPVGWEITRSKHAGEVRYYLIRSAALQAGSGSS